MLEGYLIHSDPGLVEEIPCVVYHTLKTALERHYDPAQKVYRVKFEPLYQLDDVTSVPREISSIKQLESPVTDEFEVSEVNGFFTYEFWGHKSTKRERGPDWDGWIYVQSDTEPRYAVECGGYRLWVAKHKIVEQFPLWNRVEVLDVDWWDKL